MTPGDPTRLPPARSWMLPIAVALVTGACSDPAQLPFVVNIMMGPDSVHIVPGESAVFQGVPVGSNGDLLPDRAERIRWAVDFRSVIDLAPLGPGSVTVTAKDTGTGILQATLGRGESQALVFVHPPGLDRIEIDPPSVEVQVFTRLELHARLLNEAGEEIPPDGFRISWLVEDEDVALGENTFGTTLSVWARGIGETTVRLIVADKVTTALLVVHP